MPTASSPARRRSEPGPEQADAALHHCLEQFAADRREMRGLHLRLARLQPCHRRQQHLLTAVAGFQRLAEGARGSLFRLRNLDIVFLYEAESEALVQRQLHDVAYLFGDDPLFVAGQGRDAFATVYDLASEREALLGSVRRSAAEAGTGGSLPGGGADPGAGPGPRADAGNALVPEQLAKLERALATTDLSSLTRRQSVCTFDRRRIPLPRFVELFVSIADLRDAVLPGIDLQSNRWLFQYLTEILDHRILRLLAHTEQRTRHELLSININLSTLTSDRFRQFERDLSVARNGTFIFELQGIDILSDVPTFLAVRDAAREKGHRLCLDGVHYREIDLFDRITLGIDFVKLVWDPAMLHADRGYARRLAAMVERCDPARLVLCRVDSAEAVAFGENAGITHFQGRHVERLLSESSALQRRLAVDPPPEDAA
jgi:EAL domain-containing protein (putative c-di-GMP-specific phosphodiesterase class I)